MLNNSLTGGELEYKVKLSCNDRYTYDVMHGRVNINVNGTTEILRAPKSVFLKNCGENAILFLELYRDGEMISRARWYPRWLTDLNLSKAELEVTVDREQNVVTITCIKGTALGVALDADAVFEDNYIDLLEGETGVIPYTALDGFDKIDVYGYNVDIINGI